MIEKVLGVVCLIAAGAMYTAERLSMINQEHANYFMWALTILGGLFLLAPFGRRIWEWIKWAGTRNVW